MRVDLASRFNCNTPTPKDVEASRARAVPPEIDLVRQGTRPTSNRMEIAAIKASVESVAALLAFQPPEVWI